MLQTKAHVTRAQWPQIKTPTETYKHFLSISATVKMHSAHSLGAVAAHSEQRYLYVMEIYKRKLRVLKTFRALLNESGTFGVYPKLPNKNLPSKMQTVLEVEAQKHTGQGAQTVLATHAPNKTIGPPDNLEIGATHPRSAAQAAQHMSNTAKPVKHQGMSQQIMFRQKKLGIYTKDQHWVTYDHHISHWHRSDREIAPKKWMNRLPKAPTISNTHTSALSKPKTQLGTNKGRQDQVGGNETQVSPKQLQKAFHISHLEQKVNVTTKAASQNQRSETAPPASRHPVRQRTRTNTNEIGKTNTSKQNQKELIGGFH
jgi:hypothetical protein